MELTSRSREGTSSAQEQAEGLRNATNSLQQQSNETNSVQISTSLVTSGPGMPKTKKLEELWAGDIQFWCGGKLMASGISNAAPMAVLLAQLAGFALLFAFPVPYLTDRHDGQPAFGIFAAILSIVTVSLFIATATSDPGILPRCPKLTYQEEAQIGAFNTRPPRKQNIVAHGRCVTRQYCDICYIFQPPGTVHCSVCKNCVRRFDHHCPWVGNCIGARNYKYFFGFVVFATISLVYSVTLAVIQVIDTVQTVSLEGGNLTNAIGSMVLIILCAFLLLFVLALFAFHIQLLCSNKTTFEQIQRIDNPFASIGRGLRPIQFLLFGSSGPSYLSEWVRLMDEKNYPDESPPSNELYGLSNKATAVEVPFERFDHVVFFENSAQSKLQKQMSNRSHASRRETFQSIPSSFEGSPPLNGPISDDLESVKSYATAQPTKS